MKLLQEDKLFKDFYLSNHLKFIIIFAAHNMIFLQKISLQLTMNLIYLLEIALIVT